MTKLHSLVTLLKSFYVPEVRAMADSIGNGMLVGVIDPVSNGVSEWTKSKEDVKVEVGEEYEELQYLELVKKIIEATRKETELARGRSPFLALK